MRMTAPQARVRPASAPQAALAGQAASRPCEKTPTPNLSLVPAEPLRTEDRLAVLTADTLLAFAITSLTLAHFPTATVVRPELNDLRDGRHLDQRGFALLIADAALASELDKASLDRWLRPFRDVPMLLLSESGASGVFEGGRAVTQVPRSVSPRGLTEAIGVALRAGEKARGERRRQRPQEIERITATQWRVVGFLGCGCSNKEIAFRMGISEATVKAHVGGAIARLGLTNRTEVALFAQRLTLGSRWAASAAAADAPS